MTTREEFQKMSMEQMKAKVEEAERQVNAMHQHMIKYGDDNNLDANVIAAYLMGALGRMITTTVGNDVAKQDAYLATVLKGIAISMAENGMREFSDDVAIPPWLRN